VSRKCFSARFVDFSTRRVRLVIVGGENSNKMDGRRPAGCTAGHGNSRLGQTNWRERNTEVPFGGG
jgi:hypothetical protein